MRVGPHLGESTHLWRCVLRWQLQKFCVFRLGEFICSTVQNRRIIIVLNLTPIQACNEQIGNPVLVDDSVDDGACGGARQPTITHEYWRSALLAPTTVLERRDSPPSWRKRYG